MRTIQAKENAVIVIGKYDENIATKVVFDVSKIVLAYPFCNINLVHKRSRDVIATPVGSFTHLTGSNLAYWNITRGDTIFSGQGLAELNIYQGSVHKKSITYKTLVVESATQGSADPILPFKSWVEKVMLAAELAKGSADWNTLRNKPDTFPPSDHTHDADNLTYTEKDIHTPGSIGEAIALCTQRVHIVNELPSVDNKYRGNFFFLLQNSGDKLYVLVNEIGVLKYVLIHDFGVVDAARYDHAQYDVSKFG